MSKPRRKRSSFRRVVLSVLVVIVLIVAAAAGWTYWRWTQVPAYWQAHERFLEQTDAAALERAAERTRDRVLRELTRLERPISSGARTAPAKARTLRLPLERINAWLATRLDDWLANQDKALPPGVGPVMVAIDQGKPIIAFAYRPDAQAARTQPGEAKTKRIISLVMDLSINEQGKARAELRAVRVNGLRLPRERVLARLREQFEGQPRAPMLDRLLAVLKGKPFDPVWPLDSRQVRVLNFQVTDEAMVVRFRHEKASGKRGE